MRKLLTLVAVSLVGCAPAHVPNFPSMVDAYFQIVFVGTVPHCLHFEIVSNHPLLLSEHPREVELQECNLVGGFKPEVTQKLFSWIDDMWDYAESHKKCFRR